MEREGCQDPEVEKEKQKQKKNVFFRLRIPVYMVWCNTRDEIVVRTKWEWRWTKQLLQSLKPLQGETWRRDPYWLSCWIYWGVAFLFPLFWELSGKTIRTCLRLCPSISLQKNDCKRWLNATEIYSLVCVEGAEIYKEDAIGATPPLEALGASPSLPLPAPADLLTASPVSVSMFIWSSSLCASEIQISLCLLLLQRILAIGFRFP